MNVSEPVSEFPSCARSFGEIHQRVITSCVRERGNVFGELLFLGPSGLGGVGDVVNLEVKEFVLLDFSRRQFGRACRRTRRLPSIRGSARSQDLTTAHRCDRGTTARRLRRGSVGV